MNKTSDQIAADLRLKRQAFHASVEELQAKLKSVTDWRQQFEQHLVMMIAEAMGAGALLATVAGRAERRRATPPVSAVASDVSGRPSQSNDHQQEGIARQVWEPLKEALIDIAVLRLTGMLERKLPGSKDPPAGNGPSQGRVEPQI